MGDFTFGSSRAVLPLCRKHDEDRDMCCEDCKTIFCVTCGQTEHKDHRWGSIKKISSEKKKDIPEICQGIRGCIHEITESLSFINQIEYEQEKRHSGQIRKLVRQQDDMVSEVFRITNNNIEKSKEIYSRCQQRLVNLKTNLSNFKQDLLDKVRFLETQSGCMTGFQLIDTKNDAEALMTEVNNIDLTAYGYLPCFFRGKMDHAALETMYGKLIDPEHVKVIRVANFKNFSNTIVSIHSVSEEVAWVHGWDCSAYLLNTSGVTKSSIEMQSVSNDFIVCSDGAHIFTDFENDEIKKLDEGGTISTLVSTKPLTPIGIGKSLDGNLFVALVDDYSFKLSTNSKRLIKLISTDGEELTTYEFDKDGTTKLFTKPHRVFHNYNSDICVIDQTGQSSGVLRVLSSDGALKFDYRGNYVRKRFDPRGLVCDAQCNIIVTDCLHNFIHMLSPCGEFIRYLVTKQEAFDSPYSVDLHKSCLWVGGKNGDISVYRYISQD
ncbi:uncharacterized protein LOC133205265 [Saccostrea echinata]|uniref:uncharacterized protein LOC133205265 n=1 Tax=Saccostrea echinata TaxID=191078 RepID=UPI002A80FAE1|nr:uncharacterized protein LOC133205265 [Saccostrea echinata]